MGGRYLLNHDETCDYRDISDPTEIWPAKCSGEITPKGNTAGKTNALLNNFGGNERGPEIFFQNMKSNFGKACGGKNSGVDKPVYRKSRG